MVQSMHGTTTMHSPRKHIVPTHLNLPDQVLTVWSFSLSARALLLLLVGAGVGGTVWQHLAVLGHHAVPGEMLRLLLALLPFLLALVLTCYRHAGRYLEVWLVVLLRYRLRPKRHLWRSIRLYEQHLFSPVPGEDDEPDLEERVSQQSTDTLTRSKIP